MNFIANNLWTFVSIPLISGFIGYVTNYLAVKMIFRPRSPLRFCGLEILGLVPKRRKELALKIAEAVERDLISHRDVQEAVNKTGLADFIEKLVEQELERVTLHELGRHPLLAVFVRSEQIGKFKLEFMQRLRPRIPALLDEFLQALESKMDFKEIVRSKVEALDLEQLEELIYSISARELRTIEILGGVIGFVLGLGQVALLAWKHN